MKYPVVVAPLSEENGGGYLAVYPDLPGCVSDGETPEEALQNAALAFDEWMDTARKRENFQVPKPGSAARRANEVRADIEGKIEALRDDYQDLDARIDEIRATLREVLEAVEAAESWERFNGIVGERAAEAFAVHCLPSPR